MACKHCGRDIGFHLCIEAINAYRDSMTQAERDERHQRMMQLLEKAIEASKVLKEKYGIELVC